MKLSLPILLKKFKEKSFSELKKPIKEPDVDNITKRMKNLTISVYITI